MNKTQKGAWFTLASFLLAIAITVYLIVKIFILKSLPEGIFGRGWPMIAYCVLTVASVTFLRKKQSPTEPDFDERDNLIKKRVVLASFVSVWLLLAATTIIPRLIVGQDGSIPVWLLAFINVGVLFIAMLVYSVAVLIQYGLGSKGEKS